jgi:hypothetical protein
LLLLLAVLDLVRVLIHPYLDKFDLELWFSPLLLCTIMSRDDYSVERLSLLQLQGIHLLRLQLVSIRLAFQQGSINENIFYDKVNRCVVTLSEMWHLALATNEEPPVSHCVKLIVLLKEQIPLTDGEFNHVLNNVVPSAPVLPVPASLPFGIITSLPPYPLLLVLVTLDWVWVCNTAITMSVV